MSWKPFSSTVGSIESSDKSSLTLDEKLEKWKRRREMVVYLPRSPPYDMLTKRLLFGIFFLDKPKNPFARSISNLLLDDFMPIYGCKSWTCHRLKKRLDICDDFEMPNKFITVQQHGFWMEFAIVTFCKKKNIQSLAIWFTSCFVLAFFWGSVPRRSVLFTFTQLWSCASKTKLVMSFIWKLGVKATYLGCVGFTFQQHFAKVWLLEDNSMDPTLKDGDIVLVTPWTSLIPMPWTKSRPNRGDIVILKHPHNPDDWLCKRVIGAYCNPSPWGFSNFQGRQVGFLYYNLIFYSRKIHWKCGIFKCQAPWDYVDPECIVF